MSIILIIGLVVSLIGPFLWMLAIKKFGFKSISLSSRLLLWLLAIIALLLAAFGSSSWLNQMGIRSFGWYQLLGAVVATIAILVGAASFQLLLSSLGVTNTKTEKTMRKVLSLSVPYRFFIVITAAVTEEILFRSYAIGIGQHILGSLTIAFAVSLIMFVLAHFSWGISHLITVFWATLIMSLLFVITNNLFACILTHFVVDAVGFLLQPAVMARKQAQKTPQVQDG